MAYIGVKEQLLVAWKLDCFRMVLQARWPTIQLILG